MSSFFTWFVNAGGNTGGGKGSDGYKPIPCGMAYPGSSRQKFNGLKDCSWSRFTEVHYLTPPGSLLFLAGFLYTFT
jgi:hypothetical protein